MGAVYFERPGENALLKVHATAHGAAIDFDQVFADPASGGVVGTRRGRVLVALSGLVVSMLSITGVYLWWRKRRARRC